MACANCVLPLRAKASALVIYYYLDGDMPLYVLLVYPKNTKTDLTAADKKAATALVKAIKTMRKKS